MARAPQRSRGPSWPVARRLAAASGAALALVVAARAETFVFRDPTRPPVTGKVIDEFEDVLFVAVDGEAARFVARAQLEAVLDEAGARIERPLPGRFAPLAGPTPLAAVTDAAGGVALRPAAGPEQAVGPRPGYLRAGDALVTLDDGLCRVVTPAGTTAKVGPEAEVVALAGEAGERFALRRGEVLLEAALRPVDVDLGAPGPLPAATLRAAAGARVAASLGATGEARALLHDGVAELVVADGRLVLAPGLGASLAPEPGGAWRLTADAANPGPLALTRAGVTDALAPGGWRVLGEGAAAAGVAATTSAAAPPEAAWFVLGASGELLVRRGPGGAFAPVARERLDRLPLGAGDAVRAAGGAARLGRADGAAAALAAEAGLELGPRGLRVLAGEARLEAGAAPVAVDTPRGAATLQQATARVARVGDGVVDVTVGAGAFDVPLAASTVVRPEPGAVARVSAREARGRVELLAGRAAVRSRAHAGGADAQVAVELAVGHVVEAEDRPAGEREAASAPARGRGDRAQAAPGAPAAADAAPATYPTWRLPGERTLVLDTGAVRARLALTPRCVATFDTGAAVELTEGLWLALARVARGHHDDRPELRWRLGTRVLLEDALHLRVHNPRAELLDPRSGATLAEVTLDGPLAVRLAAGRGGDGAPALVLGAREDDRLEVGRGEGLAYDRKGDLSRAAWSGGRRVWAQDGARPVQARLDGDALVVTLVGARPLALPPRAITAMATREGELVIVPDDRLAPDAGGLEWTAGRASAYSGADAIPPDRNRDLLDVPSPDSPSGP